MADKFKIDLGEDDGWATIVIGGKEIKISPLEEIERLRNAIGEGKQPTNQDIIKIVGVRLKEDHGIEASPNMSLAFYAAVLDLNERVSGFFSKRLASQAVSDSTPEASAAEDSGECSPHLTDSTPSNPCDESPSTMPAKNSAVA
jgi:hypothetical protein